MALTEHQLLHLNALIADAEKLPASGERSRILREARDILSGKINWPDERFHPSIIHDWFEKPELRDAILAEHK